MKKKNTEVKKRHWFIINLAKLIMTPIIKIKYRYKYKKYKNLKGKGPFIVLGNHTVAFDPIIMSHSFPFHLYYFATEQIFNLGFLSKLLVYAANPIRKSKSMSDMAAIRKAREIVNEGGSIGIYPEGNVSYDGNLSNINESIVKLIRLLKIPVIFFVAKGLYMTDPRWSVNLKKGKSSGEIKTILYPEEYQNMSDSELYDYIVLNLNSNEYDTTIKYKGNKMALGLERLVFMDLVSNKPFKTYSKGNFLLSSDSNFKLEYLEDGHVIDQDLNKQTLVEINHKVIKSYLNYYLSNEELEYKRLVNLSETSSNGKINFKNNYLTLTKKSLIIEGVVNETFNFEEIESIAIQGKRKLIIYLKDKTYLITFNDSTSPYVYLLTYQFYKEGKKLNDKHISIHKFGL